jgi:hypothetical protein
MGRAKQLFLLYRLNRPSGAGFGAYFLIDPAQKICNALSHPSDKNKGVARVGHPDSSAIHKGQINKK